MTEHEQSQLVAEQYAAGLENGTNIANIIIRQFPDGFPTTIAGQIKTITDKARANVVDALTANQVEQKYIEPFEEGFNVGVANTCGDYYAAECATLARTI